MGLLQKIRGLYRFDGDTEPVQVSRRQFFFVSGVVLTGAALPVAATPEVLATWPAGPGATYPLSRATYPKIVVVGVDHATKTVLFDMARTSEEWLVLRSKKFEHRRSGRTQK